jgi:diguanylate cyclase (GGDEF)-like protein
LIDKIAGFKQLVWTTLLVVLSVIALEQTRDIWLAKVPQVSQLLYILFFVVALIASQFSRSRFTFAAIVLFLYFSVSQQLLPGIEYLKDKQLIAFNAMVLIVTYLSFIKDRGLISVYSLIRILAILCCASIAYAWSWAFESFSKQFVEWGVSGNIQQLIENYVFVIVCLIATFVRSVVRPSLVVSSFFTTLLLWAGAYFNQIDIPLAVLISLLMVQYLIAIVIDSYYLAYRDELTGIASRRALNQYALSLGRNYTVAMMDIDHFKKFNDTYGHDIGDQVLKLVAKKLTKVRGGGRVFRYGGEEFTAIFPRKSAADSAVELEKIRQSIQDYKIVFRQPVRQSKKARTKKPADSFKTVSVTISIGVAMRQAKHSFEQTVKHADEALYRAKKNGRNNVSY